VRRSREKARRRRLAVILLMPLLAGIVFRWPTEIWGYLHLYRLIHFGTVPLPQAIGLYAIHNNSLVEFSHETGTPDFSPWVEFLFYSEVSLYPSGRWVVKRVIPQIEPISLQQGQPLWTQWLDELERFGRQSSDWIRWSLSNDPPGVKCWVRAVPGQRAMVRITPSVPVRPGLYVLTGVATPSSTTFSVQYEKLREKHASPVRKAVEQKRWAEGLHAAEMARAYGPRDNQAKRDIEEIRVRIAVKVAQEAMSANRWGDAEKSLDLAAKLQTGDAELAEVQSEVWYHKAIIAAREATAKQDWDEAAEECEAALAAKPGGLAGTSPVRADSPSAVHGRSAGRLVHGLLTGWADARLPRWQPRSNPVERGFTEAPQDLPI